MAITVLDDVLLPESVIAAGVRGKNMRMNSRAGNQGGYQTINVIWTRTLRQFELGIIPMLPAQWHALEGVFEVTDGGAYGFLMEDPKDSTVLAGAGFLQPRLAGASVGALGFGYGLPVLQLAKLYSVLGSTRTKARLLTRPKAAPALLRGGVAVTLGAAPGNAAVDLATGLVTFVADSSQAMSSITVGATTVLNFSSGVGVVAALAVGQRVYLAGVTGTAATALNGLSHAISAKGATSLTISTSTSGLTASAGTAYKYPQASESLTWTGGFYVPVHFANDEIDWDIVRSGSADTRLLTGPSVLLQEIRE